MQEIVLCIIHILSGSDIYGYWILSDIGAIQNGRLASSGKSLF